MPWPIGADVVIRTLGNKRGVVLEVGRGGQYRLRVEGITMWCREEDLGTPPEARKKHGSAKRREMHASVPSEETAPPGRVDLHGLRVEEAIARVVDEIDRALLRGANRVEVVHGKGSGRIRDALHRHLATLPVVAAFDLDRFNSGVTWVYL